MELNSFRDLLLKKSQDNPALQDLIKMVKDEVILNKILESLEKMARPHASMGRGANAGVVAFANQMKNKDVEMMRDSLGHHIAHHKAALKAGNREVADKHLNKIIPLMHLAGKSAAHSGGQLGFDYVPLEPWESNATTVDRRPETGKLIEGTKGLGRRPAKSSGKSKYGVSRAVSNYHYLEMPPHGGHPDQSKSQHTGGYPFEHTLLGNPAKVDSKEAHLHIPEVEAKGEFTAHPFDEHPVNKIVDLSQSELTPDKMDAFANELNNWHESEPHKQWTQGVKEAYSADPEAYKSRGKTRPAHHFEDLKLQEQPEHARAYAAQEAAAVPPESQSEAVSKLAATPTTSTVIRRPKAEIDYSALPEALRNKWGKK